MVFNFNVDKHFKKMNNRMGSIHVPKIPNEDKVHLVYSVWADDFYVEMLFYSVNSLFKHADYSNVGSVTVRVDHQLYDRYADKFIWLEKYAFLKNVYLKVKPEHGHGYQHEINGFYYQRPYKQISMAQELVSHDKILIVDVDSFFYGGKIIDWFNNQNEIIIPPAGTAKVEFARRVKHVMNGLSFDDALDVLGRFTGGATKFREYVNSNKPWFVTSLTLLNKKYFDVEEFFNHASWAATNGIHCDESVLLSYLIYKNVNIPDKQNEWVHAVSEKPLRLRDDIVKERLLTLHPFVNYEGDIQTAPDFMFDYLNNLKVY